MAERVQDHKPARTTGQQDWVAANIAEQTERYAAIVAEQDALAPQREQWVAAFLRAIQTTGFNVSGDLKRIIKPGEIAKKPKGRHQVIF
jgi:hypothetical protein